MVTTNAVRWLSFRVRLACTAALLVGSLLPPYVPKAALAPPEVSVADQQFLLVEDGFLMKSSALTKHGTRRAYASGIIHSVREGESLEKIAGRYGITVDTIRWANKLEQGATIRPGDEVLILPVDGVLHTVSRGQSLVRIAELYGVPMEQIAAQNSIEGGYLLAGQELIVPGGKPIVGKPTVVAQVPKAADKVSGTSIQQKAVVTTGEIAAVTVPKGVNAEPTGGVLQRPCNNCFFTQYYHAGHYAVDIQQKGGGPNFAAEAGTVLRADYGWNGGYGNVVEIDHGNGLTTVYGHNKDLYVKAGDTVTRGQAIGWMGNTGRVYGATGIHVHFEVILNGVKKNPLLYLE